MPLVTISIGWLTGIWIASMVALPVEAILIAALVPIIGMVLWWHETRWRMIWLATLFSIFGAIRYQLAIPHFDQNSLTTYNNIDQVTLEGVIDTEPDVRDTYLNLRVNADQLTLPDGTTRSINGLVLVRPSRPAEYKYGDRIRVTGDLIAPPEFATFSYKDFLARQNIYSMIDRPRVGLIAHDQASPILGAILAFKDSARNTIRKILVEPEASLLNGILLGDDAALPQNVQADFRNTGTTHIIAISGYNITILISIISAVTVRLFGRRRSFWVLIIALIVYTIMVGASASVVRASIMGIGTLFAIYLGRQGSALNWLFAAGLIMTLLDPNTLFDVGFQLSFAATLGLIVYARSFANATQRLITRMLSNRIAKMIVEVINDALLVTLAAQVASLPLLMYYFQQFSWVSFLVNPLVLPAQSGVMVFGLIALAAGLIFIPIGSIIAWSAWIFLAWTINVIHLFALIQGQPVALGYVSPIVPVIYYAILIFITWKVRSRASLQIKWLTPRRLIFAGGLVVVLIGVALSWQPDGQLHIVALDVDGHPILVRTPQGKQILIGGSSSPSGLLSAIGQQLPFWDRDIDLLIVPHASVAELNGLLAVVDRYSIGQVVSVDVPLNSQAGRNWQLALSKLHLTSVPISTTSTIDLEPDVSIEFDRSIVLIAARDHVIGLGPSDAAQIDVISDNIAALPEQPQMIFVWQSNLSDARVVDLTDRGTLDLSLSPAGVTIGTLK
ncbi:MAG TPA: ComEC/Rec2 family competence protein [Anaerolineae bacterium]|nr:ComEC/Rec2 family competence protein [Anaerolineae bacterium]